MIKDMYFSLMQSGWTMQDIDEMDIKWYFDVMNREQEEAKKERFIDEIW